MTYLDSVASLQHQHMRVVLKDMLVESRVKIYLCFKTLCNSTVFDKESRHKHIYEKLLNMNDRYEKLARKIAGLNGKHTVEKSLLKIEKFLIKARRRYWAIIQLKEKLQNSPLSL